ncbi:integrating conjugative element protein, PFL_4709 family [Pseudomonas benzenivorans]|nr:TIGR03757 family integrating conjugative element protein [Pseudomonas benzenivorans]SDG71282.1 integrating conjugative element protein, PFL_4709 family [Pseudomonas benzenivorans]
MPYSLPQSRRRRWPLPLAALLIAATAQAETWVVTDQAHPVTAPAGVRVILLDEQQRLEERLSRSLPADPRQATTAVQRFMATPEGARLQADLARAQQGAADAWSAGVEKIPAVVVDRKYVVYGEPDVATATRLIDRARGMQR